MTFYEIIMKIIKNCVVTSLLLIVLAGCGVKVMPSSGKTSNSNPSSSNSGSGGPIVPPPATTTGSGGPVVPPPPPPPATDWRTKTVDEIKIFKDADGKNLFQLSIGNPQELKELIQKVGKIGRAHV